MHIIIMPPQHIMQGMPPVIIVIICVIIGMHCSMVMPSIGIIMHIMPLSVISQVIFIIIMGIGIMPPIMGIILFIIGIMPFIIPLIICGIMGIMLFIICGIMPLIIGIIILFAGIACMVVNSWCLRKKGFAGDLVRRPCDHAFPSGNPKPTLAGVFISCVRQPGHKRDIAIDAWVVKA